ncbi:universal stress protein [Streptomyces sp. NPDC051985]|uniref:universal stress protein n=1 Tax=Streptomyces sp. NPDC051985 TaxID=3155807 RepID=UPI00343F7E1A
MPGFVAVGLDGSSESLAAADWAAHEAVAQEVPLRVVHVGGRPPYDYSLFEDTSGVVPMLRAAVAALTDRLPGLRGSVERLPGQVVPALVDVARDAESLVLGSRGLGRTTGLLLGSVASAVVARAERPVVLVRGGAGAASEHLADASGEASVATPYRDVVFGVDVREPDDTVLGFAFAAARRRAAGLRVVHGPILPGPVACPEDVLGPWKAKFPEVEVTVETAIGHVGEHLADASRDSSLVVVGRRRRRARLGPRIGPVADTVLRHALTPVAVVPHG